MENRRKLVTGGESPRARDGHSNRSRVRVRRQCLCYGASGGSQQLVRGSAGFGRVFFSGGGGNPRAAAAQPAGDWPEKSAGSDASRPAEKPRGAAGAAVAAAASARHTRTRTHAVPCADAGSNATDAAQHGRGPPPDARHSQPAAHDRHARATDRRRSSSRSGRRRRAVVARTRSTQRAGVRSHAPDTRAKGSVRVPFAAYVECVAPLSRWTTRNSSGCRVNRTRSRALFFILASTIFFEFFTSRERSYLPVTLDI